jgi:hypothetical protein
LLGNFAAYGTLRKQLFFEGAFVEQVASDTVPINTLASDTLASDTDKAFFSYFKSTTPHIVEFKN